jgi:hypothetical protein
MIRYGAVIEGLLSAGFALFALFLFDAGVPQMAAVSLLAAVAFGYAAWREQRKPQAPPGQAEPPGNPPSLHTSLVVCAVLLAIDIVFFGAPMLGAYAGIALVLWLAPRILLAWRKPALRRHRARVALLTLGMLVVDCSVYGIYETVAQKRVLEVAEVLVRYKARTGDYPSQLRQLVPDYLPEVPPAKPGLVMLNAIWYQHRPPGPASLMYVSFPPYYRKVLDLDTLQWSVLD